MKRRLLSMFCALALCLGLLPATAWAAEEVSYVAYSWNEDTSTLTSGTKSVTEYTTVTNSDTTWSNGWYVVSGSVSSTDDITITVNGTVNLILPQGSKLDLSYGTISISDGGTLNIYGQESGSGTLTLGGYGRSTSSGISLGSGSALNIHGGTITANGYCYNNKVDAAPGIDVGTGTLTVYGGEVNAEAGTSSNAGYGAGIRVTSGGTVSIYGGTVTATGASNRSALGVSGAGIGGNGAGETCGNVTITGGTVTATGGSSSSGASAGIGGGQGGTTNNQGGGGNVTITGGTVTAIGGKNSTGAVQAPGIGGAVYNNNKGNAGSFSTGTGGSAVITTTGGIQADTSGCSAIIDNTVYGTVTLPDSLKTLNKHLTVPSGATLILPDGTTTKGTITVNGTLTVDSGSTVTNSGTITNNGTLTGGGTIQNTSSGTVTGGTGDVKVTYPSTVEVSSSTSGTAVLGQEVTFTATVTGNDTAGTPTGTVQFKDGETNLGEAVALEDGVATYTANNGLDVGEHPITAEYTPAGDAAYTGSSGSLTFTVVGDVASISVQTQPTTMTYTTGETLDLSDLVITVHYVGSTYTQDIIWSEDSGITASPENGTELSASQHNGQPITITYGDKTATTGNLTVARANPQVTAPTAKTLTYDGTDQALVTAGGTTGGTMQYSLSEDGEYTEAIPTGIDAGQYTVYYKVVGNDDYNDVAAQSVSVTIAKANAQVTAAPQAVEALAFTGQPHALVTAGSAAGGTMQYSLSEDGEYTEAIPTGTDAGDYTVWYKVVGDNNHNDTTAQSVSVTIGKAAATVTTAPQAVTGLTYTGNPQALVTAGTAEGGEMQYSTDGSNYYTDIPTGTNAGDYSVWYKVVGDENHSDTDPVEVKITIAKATPDYTVPTGLTATYGNTLNDVTLTSGWTWDDAVTTSVGNVGDNTFSATFTPSDTDNYNTVTKNLTVAVSAKDITNAVITLGDALTYTGQQQTQQIASVTVDGLTVTYTVTGNTGTGAGDYTLTVTGTGNFTGTVTQEWSIAKATYTGTTGVLGTVLANWPDKVTLPAIPAGASYGTPSTTDDLTGLSIEGGVLSYTGGESIAEGQEYEITVPVDGGKNYEDYTITVTLTGSDKQTLTITGVTAQGGTYNGQAQAGYTGTPSAEGYTGDFTVTYSPGDTTSPTNAGTYTVTIAIPDSDSQYVGSTTLDFTIAKKALIVSAPSASVYVGDNAPELVLTYTGLVDGESVTPSDTPTFTITKSDNTEITLADAVKTAGTYTITWSNEGITTFPNGTNYDITKNPAGTLKVSNRPVTPAPTPSGPSTGGSDGWTEIEDEVDETPSGSTVTVDMNGTTEVPAEVFEAVAGKDVTLELDMGGGVKWEINGQDIPTDLDFTDLDLGVSLNTSDIPVDVINMVTGEKSTVQLTLAHDGEFGFTLTLTAPVGVQNKGLWANLYHYNTTLKQMLFETSAQVDASGNVALKFTHASEYAIVLDESSHELPFTDVGKKSWYTAAVQYVYQHGIMTGTGATAFEPNTTLSRAMVAQILYNLEGQPAVEGESTFTDSNTHWAAKAIAWAQETGVVNGYEDNTFRPNRAVTREELAQMLYNYAKVKGYDLTTSGDLTAFPDGSKVSVWAKTAMAWANGNQLINGFEDDTLRPGGNSTRAQAASILMNFDVNLVEE